MRSNEITMRLKKGAIAKTEMLYQYDYGQKLLFEGVDLPETFEVHFSNRTRGESKTAIGSNAEVLIPDEYLLSGESVYVWLYLHDSEDDGETEYSGIINVMRRAKPTDQEPTPVQQDVITQAIAALNTAVTEAEGIRDAIPETVNTALEEAKASGEFDGEDGKDGQDGADGFSPTAAVNKAGDTSTITITDKNGTTTATVKDGKDGADGYTPQKGVDYFDGEPGKDGKDGQTGPAGKDGKDGSPGADGISPSITITDITGGHRVTITDATGAHSFDVMDGSKGDPGNPGQPGADGFSPTATVTKSGKVATISITDKNGTTTETVSDGEDADPTELIDDTAGEGDTNKTWSADKLADEVSDLNLALNDKLDSPETAGTSGQVLTSDGQGGQTWKTPSGGDVTDVQVNGVSVVQNGVANVPLADTTVNGVTRIPKAGTYGIGWYASSNNLAVVVAANAAMVKSCGASAVTSDYRPLVPTHNPEIAFYGLAKAAGSDEKNSILPVGQYTESAKSAISEMLSGSVSVSGTTPTINAMPGVRYVCGEVTTLDIVTPATGIVDVVFTSGSTATVLTVTPPTGMTMKWANGFDPTGLEADTVYEVNVMDGCYGVVGSWT